MSIFRMPFLWAPRVLAALWLALAILLGWLGTLPDGYLIHVRGITDPQPYPFLAIGMEVLLAACAFSIFGWALMGAAWSRIGKMGIVAAVIGSLGFLGALNAMHGPRHIACFAMAMLLVAALAVFAAVSLFFIGIFQRKR